MCECYSRIDQATKWKESGRFVTAKAEANMQLELKLMPEYVAAFSSSDVCYVTHRASTLKSNLEFHLSPPSCRCSTWKQIGLPCRHLLAALQAASKLDQAMGMFSACYTTAAYEEHFTSIPFLLTKILYLKSLLSVPHIPRAGRPRKRRFRSRAELRMRAVYRCITCGMKDV